MSQGESMTGKKNSLKKK